MIDNSLNSNKGKNAANVCHCSISVIVPVRNEENHIEETLTGLASQCYPQELLEIFVIDALSTDKTREIVSKIASQYAHIHLLDNSRKLSSSARNIGVNAASGDVILVVDGHCQFTNNQYLHQIKKSFSNTSTMCLGRPQLLDVSGASSIQLAIAQARASNLGHHPDSYIYTDREQVVPAHSVAVAYRRSIFQEIGGFDENFDACEDVELNHRIDKAGMKCVMVPQLQLKYHPRSNIKGLFRQMFRYGQGRIRLFRKHSDTFSFKGFVPLFFTIFIILGLFLSFAEPAFYLMYAMVIGLYVLVVLSFTVKIPTHSKRFSYLWQLPIIFTTIHIGAGLGSLIELLPKTQNNNNSSHKKKKDECELL